jgi:hypothetical protein
MFKYQEKCHADSTIFLGLDTFSETECKPQTLAEKHKSKVSIQINDREAGI